MFLGCQRLSKRTGVEVKCEYPTFDERLWSPEQNLEQSLEPKTDLKAEPKAELMSDPPNITSKTEAKTVSKTETKPTRKVGRPRKHPIMVPETMVGTVPTENVPNASPKASEAGATATVGITDTQLEATAHSEMGGSVNSNRPIVGMDKIVPATVSIENEIATSAGLDAAFGKLHAVANEGPSTRPSATAAAKEKDSKAGLKRATIESDAAFGWPTTETENQWAGAIEMGAAFRKLHVVAKEGTSAASSAATIGVLAQGLDATLAEAARVPDTVAGATVAAEHEDTSLHGAPVNSAANFTGVTRNHEAGLNMATKAMDPRKMAAADNKIVESESKRTPETKPSENANLFLSGGVVSAENDAVAASSMAPGKSLGVIENNVDLAATDIDRQIVLKWAADAENAKAGLETPVALAPIITSAKKDNTQDKLVRSEAFINSDPKQNKTATCALSEDFTHGTIGDDQLPLLDRTTTDEVGSSLSNRSSLTTTLSTLSTYTIAQDQIYEPASASSATLTISPTITEDEANIKVLTMLPPLLHGLSEMQMVMGSSSPIVQEALSEALINHSIIGAAQRIILEKKEIKSELRNNAIREFF
jgi:hypothetical protein